MLRKHFERQTTRYIREKVEIEERKIKKKNKELLFFRHFSAFDSHHRLCGNVCYFLRFISNFLLPASCFGCAFFGYNFGTIDISELFSFPMLSIAHNTKL